VKDIVRTNANRRAAYVAVTVPDHHGLDSMLVSEGLVLRVHPKIIETSDGFGWTGRNWMDTEKIKHALYDVCLYRNQFEKDGTYILKPYKDENARRLSQNYAAAHQMLAYEYRRQKRFDDAVSELQFVERMYPEGSPVEGVIGLFYLDAGDTARALAYYEERVRTHPSSDIYYYYGVCLGFLGRVDDAVKQLLKAGEVDPTEVQAYKAAYALLHNAGREQEAQQVVEMLIQKHPEDPEVQNYLNQADTTRRSWTGGR